MDKSSQIISKDLASPGPREEIFSKSRFSSRKSCPYIASKKNPHRAGTKNTWTRYDGNTITYVNPGDNCDSQPKTLKGESHGVEAGSNTNDNENFHWHANPRNPNNQPHSDDPGSTLDDDVACYYTSFGIETETEDVEKEQGNRRSCLYKAKRSYY